MIVHIILILFKKSLFTGTIPKTWLRTRVSFIPKPGKSDYSDPKSYRPISLCSFFLKSLERLILWYSNKTCLNNGNYFHRNLYSYQESISVEDALHSVVTKVEKALEKNQVAILLFLDINAAFSSAKTGTMIRDLTNQGLDKASIRWIQHMLRNRKVIASLLIKGG